MIQIVPNINLFHKAKVINSLNYFGLIYYYKIKIPKLYFSPYFVKKEK